MRGSTYRRGVHQLLGAVILLPYILLGVAFVQLFRVADLPVGAILVLAAVAALIAVTPAFLDGTRAVEIVAARGLLDVDLPDPVARADRESRLRSALWFALHLLFGGLTGFGLIAALPVALVFVTRQSDDLGPLAGVNPAVVTLIGVAMLLVIVYVVAGLGALAAQVAPALLGPSQAEEIAALQERAERLAERNRLARELHDSVGHALTVTTIPGGRGAAAARRRPGVRAHGADRDRGDRAGRDGGPRPRARAAPRRGAPGGRRRCVRWPTWTASSPTPARPG